MVKPKGKKFKKTSRQTQSEKNKGETKGKKVKTKSW